MMDIHAGKEIARAFYAIHYEWISIMTGAVACASELC